MFFFFQAEDGIRDADVTGVQTCALPICPQSPGLAHRLPAVHAELRTGVVIAAAVSAGGHRRTCSTGPISYDLPIHSAIDGSKPAMLVCAPVRSLGVLPLRLLVALALLAGRSEAQVDPSGPWRTLHTPHFRIHFRPAYRGVALTEAREAERAYALLASELHPPRGTVDLTLGDDIDGSNGFTTVFPSGRITILAPAPATDPGLLQYDTWLRLVTTHELAHVFHIDRTRSFWAVAQHVLGRAPGLFPNEYQPTWLVEGLATYYESRFTNGGRVRGSFHTQLLAADRAAGASRSPGGAEPFTRWSDGFPPHAYGKGASELRVLDGETLRRVAAHAVNGNASYGWDGDTVVVAQLDYTGRRQLRSDLYRWVPGGVWRRETHGARLTQPAGRSVAIELRPGANRPTVPAPADPGRGEGGGAGAGEAGVPSPDGRWIVGTRNAGGGWALVRWPADTPAAAVVLVESRSVLADPVWTPRGELWFVADPSGFPQVYAWRDEIAQALTAEPLGARSPAPLPDGTLLYSALTARGWELRRAPPLADGLPARFSEPLPVESAPPLAVPARGTGDATLPSVLCHICIS